MRHTLANDHFTFDMSHLRSLLNTTFGLLLDKETSVGNDCEYSNLDGLVERLNDRIEKLRRSGISDDLHSSLLHIKSAVVSLRDCFKNLKQAGTSSTDQDELPEAESDLREMGTVRSETDTTNIPSEEPVVHDKMKQPCEPVDPMYTAKHAELQKEVHRMETCDDFKPATECFLKSKELSEKVFENEADRQAKIMAVKIRIVSEILGNLTNLAYAAKKCMEYISDLNKIFNLESLRSSFPTWHKILRYVNLEKLFESPERIGLDSAMHTNLVVFHFIKEFIKKPVAMLHWPMIKIASEQSHHAILGEQPPKVDTPNPFTAINHSKLWIDPDVSSVNCRGEVFAKGVPVKNEHQTAPTEIMRISDRRRYGINVKYKKILGIAIDCADCETLGENVPEPTTSYASATAVDTSVQLGEPSCEMSFSLPETPCKGKMYILVCEYKSSQQYFVYVIDMEGNIQHKEGLKSLDSKQLDLAKIFCIKEPKRVFVLDVTGENIDIHICDDQGKYVKSINMVPHLPDKGSTDESVLPKVFTISQKGEIICSEGRSKLNVYSIDTESTVKKTNEINIKYVVQDAAFSTGSSVPLNNELDAYELIILCYTSVTFQYHLVIYTKNGELKQDIKLQNSSYEKAKLIFHRNGPVVLLDKNKLLYLK